jgi:hypothetical protein
MVTKSQLAIGLLVAFVLGLTAGGLLPLPWSPAGRMANFYASKEVDRKIAEDNLKEMKEQAARVESDPRIDPSTKAQMREFYGRIIPVMEATK